MSEPFTPHGEDLFGKPNQQNQQSELGDRFLLPPFSVLNARDGWWQERKRAWLALGIMSELGRSQIGGGSPQTNKILNAPNLDFYRDLEKEKNRE